MEITAQTLANWQRRGQKEGLADTRRLVERALSRHFPKKSGFKRGLFHQGSYANRTYIQSRSDIDIVVELLEPVEVTSRLDPSRFREFRRVVRDALYAGQGDPGVNSVDARRRKAIRVQTAHLNADVLPAQRAYTSDGEQCIVFWPTDSDEPIVSYPRRQKYALTEKSRAASGLKPAIRMIKHARETILDERGQNSVIAPSYFIESLIWNAPANVLQGDPQTLFENTLGWMERAYSRSLTMPDGSGTLIAQHVWPEPQVIEFIRAVRRMIGG